MQVANSLIQTNFPRVDWNLTLSMSVLTAQQIQVNLCTLDRLKALGIFLRQTLGLRPRVCLRKIPWAFNLHRGHRFTWLPSRLLHRLSHFAVKSVGLVAALKRTHLTFMPTCQMMICQKWFGTSNDQQHSAHN